MASTDALTRPFVCEECEVLGLHSRYTRQEHLDRHITAKHREHKAFVCETCSKGFARRDILRRHEQGHAKLHREQLDEAKPAVAAAARKKRETKKRPLEVEEEVPSSPNPQKATRIARACDRCSKSKLRCDGEDPCARCVRAGVSCSFERAWRQMHSGAASPESGSVSGSNDGEESMEGGSDGLNDDVPLRSNVTEVQERSVGPGVRRMSPAEGWNRAPPNGNFSGSPYSIPIRQQHIPQQHAQHAQHLQHQQHQHQQHQHQQHQQHLQQRAHPLSNSALHQPMPSPLPYWNRPPDASFGYQRFQPHAGPSTPPPTMAPSQASYSSSMPSNVPHPLSQLTSMLEAAAPRPLTPSLWDHPGRPSSSTEPTFGNVDFIDLISSASVDAELDWGLIDSSYTPRGLGTGYNSREGNSPGTLELDAILLNGLAGLDDIQPPIPSPAPRPDTPSYTAQPPPTNRILGPTSSLRFATTDPRRNSDLAVADSAAECLMQLASLTPHDSPEPESRPFSPSVDAIESPSHEETSRSSHLSHTPSDPWPLSYRPTVSHEEIFPRSGSSSGVPGFRSRLPSPQVETLRMPTLVPRLKESTRGRILHGVCEISKGFVPFEQSQRFVPQLQLLDLFIQLFFERYQPLMPMIHMPTFDPNMCPSFLVLATASIGARYAGDQVPGASIFAQALSETSRRMCQVMGDADNTLLRTVAWQQSVIFNLVAGLASGSKGDLERSQAFAGLPTTFCRRQNWLSEPVVNDMFESSFSLETRWKRWRDREEIKRLGFGAIMFHGLGTVMWDLEGSSLFVEAAKTSLPCHDSLWEASTAEEWEALFPGSTLPARGLETLAAINHLTDRSQHGSQVLLSVARDTFASSSLLTILNQLSWRAHQESHVTSLFLPTAAQFEKPFSPVHSSLDAGFEFFQDRVVLPPEIQSILPESNVTASSMALMVHLSFVTKRLPLRLLQSLAQNSIAAPTDQLLDAVRTWGRNQQGQTSRITGWHAGQILGLVHLESHSHDTPLEPMAIFYATLSLLLYIRETNTAGRAPSPPSSERVELDKLVDRTDPLLTAWLADGGSTPALSLVGDLDHPSAGEKLLRICGAKLIGLKVWRVGELLGKTLMQLADEDVKKRLEQTLPMSMDTGED